MNIILITAISLTFLVVQGWLRHARRRRVMELKIAQLQSALEATRQDLAAKSRESDENFQLAVHVAYKFAMATDQ